MKPSIQDLDPDGLEEYLARDFPMEPQGAPIAEVLAERYYPRRSSFRPKPLLVGSRKRLIDRLDAETSRIVRARDGRCVIPFCRVKYGLTCSHFFSRRYIHTRWDLRNCHAMCFTHNYAHGIDRAAYYDYMLKRWGQTVLDELSALKSCMLKIYDEQLREALDLYRSL